MRKSLIHRNLKNQLLNGKSSSLKFKIPTFLTAVLVAITCFIIIRKGVKGISNLSELLVPVMTISYLVLSFGVLFIFRDRIIPMIILIFFIAIRT